MVAGEPTSQRDHCPPCDCGELPPGWRKEPQGTWLLIRYDDTDVGARPIPNGEVFWESPDINVLGGDAFGNPTAGQPVTLAVQVWNRGDVDAAPVRVDFAFVAPSLGITTAAPQSIGTAWTTVLAGHSKVVECPEPWTPPQYPTNLHACLIATCSAPGQGDTPTALANPALDRHVGQRNLTVLEAGAGETVQLSFEAANLFARRADIQIVAAAAWISEDQIAKGPLLPALSTLGAARAAMRAQTPAESRLWLTRASLLEVRARSVPERGTVEDVRGIARVRSLRGNDRTVATTAMGTPPVLAPHADFMSLRREVHLEPGQTATADIEVEVPRTSEGSWLAVHLAQSQNGAVTGGYTILVHTGR